MERLPILHGGEHASQRMHPLLAGLKSWLRRAELAYRFRSIDRYIAVTGSCGKTTTSMLIGALLARYGKAVTASHRNKGVHLRRSLRSVRGRVDFYVQEVSGHAPGVLDEVVSQFRIDVAVVTAVGLDHGSSYRGSGIALQDAIAIEKGKLVEAVRPGGVTCLNFDDFRVRAMAERTGQRVVGFGTAPDAELRAVDIQAQWPARLRFTLVAGDRRYPVATRFVGTIMLTNILGALAVVHGLDLDLEPAIKALAELEAVRERMSVYLGADGKTYILDTQKAPYWSTELLLTDLSRMKIEGLTLVLGEISDVIGSSSGNQYRKLIRRFAEQVETIVLAGRSAEYGARLASELDNVVFAPTAYDVANYLKTRPAGVVMLKSSKALQLWRVADQAMPTAGLEDSAT